ncbi:MAG: ytrA 1 [Phycisphaerales bacterium]|nr:ytrA 1 [Phycisphaerales bacterium]
MPDIRVDASSAVPIFRQIVDGLRSLIAAGVYRPGELIPSVRQQAVTLLVNPNTVARAYEALEREGLVESRKGVGMVVATGSQPAAVRGAEEAVTAALAEAIAQARTAGMTPERIDALYRRAITGSGGSNESKSGRGANHD